MNDAVFGRELLEFGCRQRLRPVALRIDGAQEPERLVAGVHPSVGRERRRLDHVERSELHHLAADQRPPAPADRHHHVRVLVLLETRVAARRDLEVAQLEAVAGGEREARDALPSPALLVGLLLDAPPAERGGVETGHSALPATVSARAPRSCAGRAR
jgi:hypothetical protein